MLCTVVDNFYLTEEELENSPSRQDGIDAQTESMLRHYGAELIQKAGILLGCQQAVMVTGQVLLQRFYCKKSLKDYSVRRMAAACTFLACKLEECHRGLKGVIMTFDRLFKRASAGDNSSLPVLEPGTKEFASAKETIIRYERELLKNFGFIVHAEHPHNFVINYVRLLDGDNEFIQLAWNILNDSLRTTLCVKFKAEVVACGAIFYAAQKLKVPLPEEAPWWEIFSCTTAQLVDVVKTLHELYSRPKAIYIHVTKEPLPLVKVATSETMPQDNSPAQQPESSQVQPATAVSPSLQRTGAVDTDAEKVDASASAMAVVPGQNAENEATSHALQKGAGEDLGKPRPKAPTDAKDRDRDDRDMDRDHSRGSRRGTHRSDSRRNRSRSRSRSREKDRDWDRDRGRGRDRDRDRDREPRDRDGRDDRDRGRGRRDDRERGGDMDKERDRDRERDRDKDRATEQERESVKAGERRREDRERPDKKDEEIRDRERERDRVREALKEQGKAS